MLALGAAVDGSGYDFLAELVNKIDGHNPQLAARLTTSLRTWRRLEPTCRAKAEAALISIRDRAGVSKYTFEVRRHRRGAGPHDGGAPSLTVRRHLRWRARHSRRRSPRPSRRRRRRPPHSRAATLYHLRCNNYAAHAMHQFSERF